MSPKKKSVPSEPRERSAKRKQAVPAEPAEAPAHHRGLGDPLAAAAAAADLLPLFTEHHQLEEDIDRLDAEMKQLKAKRDTVGDQILAEFERVGTQSMKVPKLGVFHIVVTPRPKVIDEAALFADLRKRGLEALIREQVNSKQLGSLVKELRSEGKPDPKGVEVWEQKDLRTRKA